MSNPVAKSVSEYFSSGYKKKKKEENPSYGTPVNPQSETESLDEKKKKSDRFASLRAAFSSGDRK